jgi:hypothetical protein
MAGRLRVSISGTLAFVAVCALAFAALRTASMFWFGAVYTFTTAILLWAVLAARFGRREERAFWYGFAVFGWGSFLIGSGGWLTHFNEGEDIDRGSLNPSLLTSRLILFLVPRLRKDTVDLSEISQITANTIGIAYMLVTLAVALVGGCLAVALWRRRRRGAGPARSGRDTLRALILVTVSGLGLASLQSMTGETPLRAWTRHYVNFEGRSSVRFLELMGERPLQDRAPHDRNAIVYRFIWLPTFKHPVCVRIERAGRGARLHVRVLDGAGGYDWGQVAIDREFALGEGAWKSLEGHLAAADFWNMPRVESLGSGGVEDPNILEVEGLKGGIYHSVHRVLPNPAFVALCRFMLDQSGLKVGEEW